MIKYKKAGMPGGVRASQLLTCCAGSVTRRGENEAAANWQYDSRDKIKPPSQIKKQPTQLSIDCFEGDENSNGWFSI